MGRSGYSDEVGDWSPLWRGAVEKAIRGKRGQAFLRELLSSLDEMPDKKLICTLLESHDGQYYALGVIGKKRGMDLPSANFLRNDSLARKFGIAPALIAEIEFENDDDFGDYGSNYSREYCGYLCEETPEQRWARVRGWVLSKIIASEECSIR